MVDGALGELLGVHIRGLCDVDCAQPVGTDATDLAIDLADPTCPALPGNCVAWAALWPAGAPA